MRRLPNVLPVPLIVVNDDLVPFFVKVSDRLIPCGTKTIALRIAIPVRYGNDHPTIHINFFDKGADLECCPHTDNPRFCHGALPPDIAFSTVSQSSLIGQIDPHNLDK